ncbi:hypothetical protein ACH5RR_022568 [Cinchona calisaya]|uniref:RING-type domain-containing protein n=1 Tax=Cinchona calisaya TaxID=153742 RepID=A0ABD2ZA05_9GENT
MEKNQQGGEELKVEDTNGVRDLTGESLRVHDGVRKLMETTGMKTTMLEEEGEKTKDSCSRNDHLDTPAGVSRPGPSAVVLSSPPADDCCPICFGDFVLPCSPNCGHWCILQLWHYKPVLQLCDCPICCRLITKLSPQASLFSRRDGDVQMLKDIQQYNHLSVHGWEGLFLSLLGVLCWFCNLGPDPIEWLIYFPQMADRWATAVIVIFALVYIYRRLMRARRLAAAQLEHL